MISILRCGLLIIFLPSTIFASSNLFKSGRNCDNKITEENKYRRVNFLDNDSPQKLRGKRTSSYQFMQFDKCQHTQGEDPTVTLHLCSDDECDSYDTKTVPISAYLDVVVDVREEEETLMCANCCAACDSFRTSDFCQAYESNYNGNDHDASIFNYNVHDCDSCVQECENFDNDIKGQFIVQSTFDCVPVWDRNGTMLDLWVGPVCTSQGSHITIGVFTDNECKFLDESKDVEDYVVKDDEDTIEIDYDMIKTTYDNTDPISCHRDDGELIYNACDNIVLSECGNSTKYDYTSFKNFLTITFHSVAILLFAIRFLMIESSRKDKQ